MFLLSIILFIIHRNQYFKQIVLHTKKYRQHPLKDIADTFII